MSPKRNTNPGQKEPPKGLRHFRPAIIIRTGMGGLPPYHVSVATHNIHGDTVSRLGAPFVPYRREK